MMGWGLGTLTEMVVMMIVMVIVVVNYLHSALNSG
jgi:hypothetical protein